MEFLKVVNISIVNLLVVKLQKCRDLFKRKFDLAGFSVGIVSKRKIFDKNNVKENDVILAIPSSGIHSNGFSLVRSILKKKMLIKIYKRIT